MEVEWLILADFAQVVDGKLYLMGGGWSLVNVSTGFPVSQRCAVALSVQVPWNETNHPHALEIEVATEDGQRMARVEGQFEVGRPPGMPPGQPQRVQFAADIALTFEQPGAFVVTARVDSHTERRVPFAIAAVPSAGTRW